MCEVTVKFEQHLSHHSCQHLTKIDNFWTSFVTFDKLWPHWWARPSLTISITYPFGQHGMVLFVCICDLTNSSQCEEGSVSKVPTAAPTPIPTAAPTAEPTPVPTVFEQDFDFMWFAFRTMGMSPWANIIGRIWKFGGLVLDYIEAEFWKYM